MVDDLLADVAFDEAFAEAVGQQTAPTDVIDEVNEPVEDNATDDSEPVVEAPADTPQTPDYAAELEALKRQNADLLATMKTTEATTQPPAKSEPEPEPETDAEWVEFEQEWPDIARMVRKQQIMLEKQYQERTDRAIKAALEPFTQQQAQTEQERFIAEIKSSHPDALDLIPEVEAWASKQPAHVKVGVDYVLNKGTAKEVTDLYDTFKLATGKVAPTMQEQRKPDPVQSRKLVSMGAVRSARTNAAAANTDPDDFDGAFAQASKQFAA